MLGKKARIHYSKGQLLGFLSSRFNFNWFNVEAIYLGNVPAIVNAKTLFCSRPPQKYKSAFGLCRRERIEGRGFHKNEQDRRHTICEPTRLHNAEFSLKSNSKDSPLLSTIPISNQRADPVPQTQSLDNFLRLPWRGLPSRISHIYLVPAPSMLLWGRLAWGFFQADAIHIYVFPAPSVRPDSKP